jgi:dTDP-4-amino-4,6-dideoxy-D-galactose acyltransferase
LHNTIEPLTWDSQFFGYPVARIVFDQEGFAVLDSLFDQLVTEKYRLTYIFVPPTEKRLITCIEAKGGLLADQKVIFGKTPEQHTVSLSNIIEFQGNNINQQLIGLVLQAGLFSRFRIDKNFENNEYERLYIEWLTKSIKKLIAFSVMVAMDGSDSIGLTTISKNAPQANIGLFAVDEHFRGRGIGQDLIHSADTASFELGLKELKVVTQLQNKVACSLYEKCNFQIEKITNVFHYWQK